MKIYQSLAISLLSFSSAVWADPNLSVTFDTGNSQCTQVPDASVAPTTVPFSLVITNTNPGGVTVKIQTVTFDGIDSNVGKTGRDDIVPDAQDAAQMLSSCTNQELAPGASCKIPFLYKTLLPHGKNTFTVTALSNVPIPFPATSASVNLGMGGQDPDLAVTLYDIGVNDTGYRTNSPGYSMPIPNMGGTNIYYDAVPQPATPAIFNYTVTNMSTTMAKTVATRCTYSYSDIFEGSLPVQSTTDASECENITLTPRLPSAAHGGTCESSIAVMPYKTPSAPTQRVVSSLYPLNIAAFDSSTPMIAPATANTIAAIGFSGELK